MMPNGLKAVVVSNLKDLELLMMHTSKYAAEIAHNVSSRKRVEILARAKVLSIK
jgi:large subunit ribosomal protein L32e